MSAPVSLIPAAFIVGGDDDDDDKRPSAFLSLPIALRKRLRATKRA